MMRIGDYRVFLRKEKEGGYTVLIPALPGCVAYGETKDQAIAMMQEAIQLYMESLQAHGEALPLADESVESEPDKGWRRWRGELIGSDALTEHLTGHADEIGKDIESQVTAPDDLADEREFWYRLADQGLALTYGDDEPDYSQIAIKEPNPEHLS